MILYVEMIKDNFLFRRHDYFLSSAVGGIKKYYFAAQCHYNDVTWVPWHVKSSETRLLAKQPVHVNIKNTTIPLEWSFAKGIHWCPIDFPTHGQLSGKYLYIMMFAWYLTHWGRLTHIYLRKNIIIGSEKYNIVDWTIGNKLRWKFNRNLHNFNPGKAFDMSSGNWQSFCLSLNE